MNSHCKKPKEVLLFEKAISMAQQQDLFQIQIVSDLHLESYTNENPPLIPQVAPFVAVLGDIGYPKDLKYQQFVLGLADKFQKVFIIAGNHEYYGSTREETNTFIANLCLDRKNIVFLNRSTHSVGNVKILGCTLWTNIPDSYAEAAQTNCNDYQNILIEEESGKRRTISVEEQNQWHKEDLQWLTEELIKCKSQKQPVIVLTHHAPTEQNCISPTQSLSCIDCTDLEFLIEPPIAVWAFGHTHHNCDFRLNGVRLVTNQMGTLPQGLLKTFKADKVVEFPIEAHEDMNIEDSSTTSSISSENMQEASNLIDLLMKKKPEKEHKKRKYFEEKNKQAEPPKSTTQSQQQIKYTNDDELESFLSSNPSTAATPPSSETKPKKKMTFKF